LGFASQYPQRPWMGFILSAALLTKAYFLALLPWAAVILVRAIVRKQHERRAPWYQMLAAAGTCFACAGWYYLRILKLTGTLTGEQNDVAARFSRLSFIDALISTPWVRDWDFIAISHIWLGNWSFIGARTWMYRSIEVVYILGFLGLVLQMVRPRGFLPKGQSISILAMPYAFFVLGLGYHAAQSFRDGANAGTMGYYLFALVVPEVILLFVGLLRLFPERRRLMIVPALAIVFSALDQFGAVFLLLPYYGGILQHDTRGHLPTLKLSQLSHGGLGRMFEGLVMNKPTFLTSSELMGLMALSFAATLSLVWIACLNGVPPPSTRGQQPT
jgi:hypothetical protein